MAHSPLLRLVPFLHIRAYLAAIIARHADLLVKDLDTFLRERLHEYVLMTDSGLVRTIRVVEVKHFFFLLL